MKIDLATDEVGTWGYNRDNGPNAAENAIEALRRSGHTNGGDIPEQHEAGKLTAIRDAEEQMGSGTTEAVADGTVTITLGLKDVAYALGPAVERAKR